jgi:hypothetical protein
MHTLIGGQDFEKPRTEQFKAFSALPTFFPTSSTSAERFDLTFWQLKNFNSPPYNTITRLTSAEPQPFSNIQSRFGVVELYLSSGTSTSYSPLENFAPASHTFDFRISRICVPPVFKTDHLIRQFLSAGRAATASANNARFNRFGAP